MGYILTGAVVLPNRILAVCVGELEIRVADIEIDRLDGEDVGQEVFHDDVWDAAVVTLVVRSVHAPHLASVVEYHERVAGDIACEGVVRVEGGNVDCVDVHGEGPVALSLGQTVLRRRLGRRVRIAQSVSELAYSSGKAGHSQGHSEYVGVA